MSLRETLSRLKGISVLGATNLAVKPLWLGFLAFLCPRYLPVEGLGVMLAALALAALVQSFADFGVSEFTLREVSRAPENASAFLSTFLPVRLALLTGCVVIALGISVAFGYADPGVVLLAALYQMASSLLYYLRMYARALGHLSMESISTVIERGSVIGFGSAMVVLTHDVVLTLSGMVLGAFLGLVHILWALHGKQVVWRIQTFRALLIRTSLPHMLPIGLLGLGIAFNFRLDMVMVPALLGDLAAAQYGQATRVIEAFSLLPSLVISAFLFPRLVRHARDLRWTAFRSDLLRVIAALVALAASVALVVSLFAPLGMRILVGSEAYADSASVLGVLVWAFPLTCVKDALYACFIILSAYRSAGALLLGTSVAFFALLYVGLPVGGLSVGAWTRIGIEAGLVLAFSALLFRMLKDR